MPVHAARSGSATPARRRGARTRLPKASDKTGTTQAVKTPPPKETARITVKPSLPSTGPRPAVAGSPPSVKPAVAAVAGAGAAVVAGAAVAKKPDVVPVAGIPAFNDEKSTTLTTVLAGVLALLTWSTAGILFASLQHWI